MLAEALHLQFQIGRLNQQPLMLLVVVVVDQLQGLLPVGVVVAVE
jgi:hypothetical protein